MPRKKPFSNKQKKKQLQSKRGRKRGETGSGPSSRNASLERGDRQSDTSDSETTDIRRINQQPGDRDGRHDPNRAHSATRPPACPIVYTREQLLGLRDSAFLHAEKPVIPVEIRRRRRGSRGGRKRKRRPYLPSIIMGNVRSISNKTEELAALARHQRE